MKRLLILIVVLTSCNCDEYYNKDEKIKARLNDYKDAYQLISQNYELLKLSGLSFKSGSPGLEGVTLDYAKIKRLTEGQNNPTLDSIRQIWENKLIEPDGEISYYIMDSLPAIDFKVKGCRRIDHIIYYGENDMYDHRGQSDDFSIFHLDSLEGHWRYVIQQTNGGQ